ncbi:MAG: PaaI family thioesterase [Terriglobales bacterium]
MLQVIARDVERAMSDTPFVHQYGFRLHSTAPGECTIYFPFQKGFLRPDGLVSGPVLMAAADLAMWLAVITKLGEPGRAAVTVEMKTNFLSAARDEFWCTAKLLKLGGRLIFGTAECKDRDGLMLTHHTFTYVRQSAKPK